MSEAKQSAIQRLNSRYECVVCGKSFGTESGLNQHKSTISEDQHMNISKAKEMANGAGSGPCVYTLEIQLGENVKTHYYVGMTKNLEQRLLSHFKGDSTVSYHSKSEGIFKAEYEVIDLLSVEQCSDRSEAQCRERETLLEVAIEHDTTNVVGGR